MKINKLNMISYGKFDNKEILFTDGLNIVKGDNGSGKSTIMAFIRAMFFGFDGRGGISVNDRKHYLPWGKQSLSGDMDITTDEGRKIKISRLSGRSVGNDKKSIMDMSTSEEVDFSAEEELSCKSDAFSKTLYIKQLGSVISGEDSEISAKLINLTNSANEDIDTKKTVDIITDYLKKFKALRGEKGILSELEKEINETNEKLYSAKKKREEDFSFAAEKRQLTEKADALKKELEIVRTKLESSKNDHLFERFDILSGEYDSLNDSIEEKLNLYENIEAEIEKMSAFEKEPPEEMFTPPIETDSINKEIKKYEKPFMVFYIIKTILKYLAVILAIAGFFYKQLFIASALCLVLFISCSIFKNKTIDLKVKELGEEVYYREKHNEALRVALEEYRVIDIREYAEKKASYTALKTERENINSSLNSMYERRDAITEELKKIKTKTNGLQKSENSESYEKLLEKSSKISTELEEIIKKSAHIDGMLSKERTIDDAPEILFARLKELNAQYEDATKEYHAAQLALDTVNQVFTQMRSDFTPLINEKASKYLSILTKGELEAIYVDKAFNVSAEKEGVKELSYFSLGTVDQTYFAIRLAIIDLLFGKDKPIFIDDAFLQYDKERELNAFKLLKQKADEGQQIIFFTCKAYPDIEGANIINL